MLSFTHVGIVAIVFIFTVWFSLWRRRREPKSQEAKSIPTGVSRWSYLSIGSMLLFGPLLLIMGGGKVLSEIAREINGSKTTGVVTGHNSDGTYKGRPAFLAQFKFDDAAKVSHFAVDSESETHPPAVGSAVEVIYDAKAPENARINNFQARWIFPGALLSGGIFFLVFAGGGALQILRIRLLKEISRPSAQVGPIEGRLVRWKKNFFLSQKNRPSWRLIVEYQDLAGRTFITESEPIWQYNPEVWAKKTVPVPLYLDRANPSRAWIRVQDYFIACK